MSLDDTEKLFDGLEMAPEVAVKATPATDMHAAITLRPKAAAIPPRSLVLEFTMALGDVSNVLGYCVRAQDGTTSLEGQFNEETRDQVAYFAQLAGLVGAELGLERLREMVIHGTSRRLTRIVGNGNEVVDVVTTSSTAVPAAVRGIFK